MVTPAAAGLPEDTSRVGCNMGQQAIEQSVDTLIRNWWIVALRGVVALIFGVLTLFRPAVTLAVLILLFGAFAVANGVFTMITAIVNRRGEPRWVSLVVSGALSVALGILTFLMPGVTGIVLLYIIAAWAIVVGNPAAVVGERRLAQDSSEPARLP